MFGAKIRIKWEKQLVDSLAEHITFVIALHFSSKVLIYTTLSISGRIQGGSGHEGSLLLSKRGSF